MMTPWDRNIQRNELFYTAVFGDYLLILYFAGIPLVYRHCQITILQPLSVCRIVNVTFRRCILDKQARLYFVLECVIYKKNPFI